MPPTPLTPQEPLDPKPQGELPNEVPAQNTTPSGTSVPTTPGVTPEAAPQPEKPKDPFDLGSILLPKKETPGQTPQSAQRVNAGVLLEQEQNATLKGTLTSATPGTQEPAPATPSDASAPKAPEQPPAVPAEESVVKPLTTYRGAIESIVKDQNVSILSIATAEAMRRGSQVDESSGGTEPKSSILKTIGLYALGFFLLAGASGALAYIIQRPTSVGIIGKQEPVTPFIAVDGTKDITIAADTTRQSLMASLVAAKEATSLSLGLVSRLLVTVASSTPDGPILLPIDAQSFFTLISPNMPPALLRTIRPTYLLGVHVYKNNEPLLILSVDSYEQAYAGMIAWEPYLKQDLAPLFNTVAATHIPEEGLASTTPSPDTRFIQTGFTDSIVENHDARVIQNTVGDITLLWTFLDRNTLVITTDTTAVREIISRIKNAPITSVSAQ